MSQNKKRIILSIGFILLSSILKYRIPHKSITLLQYILKPLQNDKSILHYFNLVPLFLLIFGIFSLMNLEQLAKINKFLLFLILIILLPRSVDWSSNMIKSSYYWIHNDNLKALDITDSNISYQVTNDKLMLLVDFRVTNYGRNRNTFSYRIHLPKTISNFTENELYTSNSIYTFLGYQNELKISETIELKLKDGFTTTDVLNRNIDMDIPFEQGQYVNASFGKSSNEMNTFELFNEHETIKINYRDPYGVSIN